MLIIGGNLLVDPERIDATLALLRPSALQLSIPERANSGKA
jgi:hypothetical protein